LTGDVGRGCGDASRALLFCPKMHRVVRDTIRAIFLHDTKSPARWKRPGLYFF
jgi:hypothetical protein